MTQDNSSDVNIPTGLDFLKLVWKQEDACELETDKRIPELGIKAPACLEEIGTALSFLDRIASCWWACQKGDHQIERLCGRVASNARAAMRLLRFGFYDESLVHCRAMGEASNLLYLFVLDKDALDEWKRTSPSDRPDMFRPVKVRVRIESLSESVPVAHGRYELLSNRTAHVNATTNPQSYNFLGIPTLGGYLQDEGVLLCLNELALPLCYATSFGAIVLNIERDIQKQIFSSVRNLAKQIGGATITEIDDFHTQLWKNAEAP